MDDAEGRYLDTLYRGVTDNDAFKQSLEQLQAIFDCSAGAFATFDTQLPRVNFAATSGIFDTVARPYLEHFASIDPAAQAFATLPAGTISSTERLVSADVRRRHPFVNEFFRPIGLVDALGGNLLAGDGRFCVIGLQRDAKRSAFDGRDIEKLQQLAPHIVRVLQLRRTFFQAQDRANTLEAMLNRSAVGMLILNGNGSAVFVNAAMQAIANRKDGISLSRSGVPQPAESNARKRLNFLLADVAKGGAGGVIGIPRNPGRRNYVMLVAPAPRALESSSWERDAAASAVILVHDPDGAAPTALDILEQGLNLPKASARLVLAMAGEEDLQSFSAREGITIHTVRYHLRTALMRTGTKTQAELVRVAVRLLRDLAISRTR